MEQKLKQTQQDLHLIKCVFEKNENLSQDIFKHMPIGICITDENGLFTKVNDAYSKIYKYERDELIGEHFLKVVSKSDQPILSKLYDDFMSNRFELHGKWTVQDSQGDTFEIMTNAAHIKDVNTGEPQKMTFVVLAKELEDTLEQLRNTILLLERKIKAQDSATNLAEHDMRNNLGSIISIASILENSSPTADQLKWLKMIKEIGYDTIDLLKASNDYTKMETDSYEADLSEFDLIAVLKKELELLNDQISHKMLVAKLVYNGQEVSFEDLKLRIQGDLFYIHRIFRNLITNAVEASRAERILEICIEDKADLNITIHNDGAVPENIRDHFFDKYITHGKLNGTGLGTYIVKLITNLHKGQIDFTSDEMDGTKIILKFPKEMIVTA